MKFVELERGFLPVVKGDALDVDISRYWNHKYSGAVRWPELRKYHRIILLAEALSGKTEEFRNQVELIRRQGHSGFFVRIEELADEGFEAALDPSDVVLFHAWKNGGVQGWFFLDSLDEARLNKKSFETALKKLARVLGPSLNRAHIFVSCRVSDWAGDKDRATIERILPAYKPPAAAANGGNALLDPIFEKDTKDRTARKREEQPAPVDLRIFRIAPLLTDQYKKLASACGVTDSVAFSNAVVQHGLDMFTERPGDVIDLANYWKTHHKFDTFEKMTEYAVSLKLREEDPHRTDNAEIPDGKARQGAELLAAALTLGKSFTLKIPSHELDPALSQGAVDPAQVLADWTPAARNALTRRPIFAPATYGRIRYHHRATQEYLTAKWLSGLVKIGCPLTEVWNLIFAERYGVKTVVPSLHPIAAWLSLWHPAIRDEVIKREPLVLIRNGDPASLPIYSREKLLETFAAKQAIGEISNDSLDQRALWMFADKKLEKSIRRAWAANARQDFRLDLLRLIREGEIFSCSDFALEVALDPKSSKYHLSVAADILKKEKKPAHLKKAAAMLKARAGRLEPRAAASIALAVFPSQMSVLELLSVLIASSNERSDQTDGMGYHLADLYALCPTDAAREEFISGLAALCLKPPFAEPYQRVSKKYFGLAKGLEAVAHLAVAQAKSGSPSPGLVSLLMAVERADRDISIDDGPPLAAAVREWPELNRALFWADVHAERKIKNESPAIRVWQIYFHGHQLWQLGLSDLHWLKAELKNRKKLIDRQIVLSAIADILRADLRVHEAEVRALIKGNTVLNSELGGYLEPPKPGPESEWKLKMAERDRLEKAQSDINKQSWIAFREEIVVKASELSDINLIKTWQDGSSRLFTLTRWLQHRTATEGASAAKEWRLLAEAFNDAVAEAYMKGMLALWRLTTPEGPRYNADGSYSYNHTSRLSVSGIAIEAAEDPEWVAKLSDDEVIRAFRHGVSDEFGYPEWLDDLISAKSELILPELKGILQTEWAQPKAHHTPFLYRFASGRLKIGPDVQVVLLEVISGNEPPQLHSLECGIRILKRLDLGEGSKGPLFTLASNRLQGCVDESRRAHAIRYIAWMMVVDVNRAYDKFADWIAEREASQPGYGEWAFGVLYERHDPIVFGVLDGATVETLEKSLGLAYRYVRPEDDVHRDGAFTPDQRDAAESGRNTVLGALLARSGPDAYRAMQRASTSPAFKLRQLRFKELAKGKAEADAEQPAWDAAEVVKFGTEYTAPAKTGTDLLNVVSGVLAEIQHSLGSEDVTSRALLLKAAIEDEVKNWLVEQMKLRSGGRFLAYRETEIAFSDRPDVIASSASAPVAVAFEVKHGGKNWTVKDHELALTSQLAEDYLKPAERRQGIFVISNHGNRTWRHPVTGAMMVFGELMAHLQRIALGIKENSSGAIEVRVVGLDAAQEKPQKPHRAAQKNVYKRRAPSVVKRIVGPFKAPRAGKRRGGRSRKR